MLEPKFNLKTYGSRSFSVCAPRLWNSLPLEVRKCHSTDTFKRKLKTHLFNSSYSFSFICILVLLLLLFFGTCEALLDIVMNSALYK